MTTHVATVTTVHHYVEYGECRDFEVSTVVVAAAGDRPSAEAALGAWISEHRRDGTEYQIAITEIGDDGTPGDPTGYDVEVTYSVRPKG